MATARRLIDTASKLRLIAVLGTIGWATVSATRAEENALPRTTSAELWKAFQSQPYAHTHVPNVSYAGYRYGEEVLPEPRIVADVKRHGAVGDGQADDTEAFRAAIAAGKAAGGGAILVPGGRYKLTNILALDESNLVLRGEGPDKTTLLFTVPVSKVAQVTGAWYGGMIWIEPGGPSSPPKEDLEPRVDSVPIVKDAATGSFAVQVSLESAQRLRPLVGRVVPVTWTGGMSLCMEIAGHESMREYKWESWSMFAGGQLTWTWANEIVAVEGTTVRFKKPLRLNITLQGENAVQVAIGAESPFVTGSGVERLSIHFPDTKKARHLKEPGFNGVMLRRAAHCWVRDVVIHNTDTAVNMAGEVINSTVTGLRVTGRPNHHVTMMRMMSHDNVIENFQIESTPHHGINTEGMSSGNVWRNGVMNEGTFDSHCMMSFDSVRTNIRVKNSGGPGGAGNHGPFAGRRMVHWNIQITNGKGEWIATPALHPVGALVGIQGAEPHLKAEKLWHMPDGLDKGCVLADWGTEPPIKDLYQAQLEARLKKQK